MSIIQVKGKGIVIKKPDIAKITLIINTQNSEKSISEKFAFSEFNKLVTLFKERFATEIKLLNSRTSAVFEERDYKNPDKKLKKMKEV